MYPDNVNLFIGLHAKVLKYLGVWMTEKPNRFYCMYQMFALTLQYSIPLFILIYLGQVIGDLDAMSSGLYVLFTQVSTCLKMTSLVVNRKDVINLLKLMNCETFVARTEAQQNILSAQSHKMRRLFFFLLILVTINCTEWSIVPVLNRHGTREYAFTMWMPGNKEKSPDYELGYLYQVLFAFWGAFVFMGIDALTITMISFGSAQLDIVKDKIKKIQKVPFFTATTQRDRKDIIKENNILLTECLAQHQAILRFIADVKYFFNINIFFQLSGSAIIVCLIGFRITMEPPTTMQFYCCLNYMISMLAQLYIHCWIGSELTIKSQELRDELYQSPWYDQDTKFRRKLCFAMECMKKPIVFKASHFITLSRPTFVSILRCSYSYFAVLNQAKN